MTNTTIPYSLPLRWWMANVIECAKTSQMFLFQHLLYPAIMMFEEVQMPLTLWRQKTIYSYTRPLRIHTPISLTLLLIKGNQKVSVHLTITVQRNKPNNLWFEDGHQMIHSECGLHYTDWTMSSKTHFGVSINVRRLARDSLNITCNFLYCNHQVQRDFLIILYYPSYTPLLLMVYSLRSPKRVSITHFTKAGWVSKHVWT
jgi:hypothetical protein